MLISKNYSTNDIVSFKLVNGDEIIAKIVETTDDGFVVNRPCTVIPSQHGLGLVQTMFSGDINTNITLNKQHVIMHCPAVDAIGSHYIQTTTGIQPVSKGGIIT